VTFAESLLGGLVWLGLTFAAAWIGTRFLPDAWFQRLNKPPWNPPNWLFAPVWTMLYVLMAVAAWLVWRRYGLGGALIPLSIFVLQLALNSAWTWLFFGRHQPLAALVDIVLLWVVILVLLTMFWRLEPLAGVMMIPYLAWVSFASVLNWSIWRLNLGVPTV
jgi:benzodiazapine receptor